MADKGNLTSATANMGGWETAGWIFGQKIIKIQSIFGPYSIVFPLKAYSALFQISIEKSQGVFFSAMFQIGDWHRFKQFPKTARKFEQLRRLSWKPNQGIPLTEGTGTYAWNDDWIRRQKTRAMRWNILFTQYILMAFTANKHT